MSNNDNIFTFTTSSLEPIRFANELSDQNIEFQCRELIDMEGTSGIQYIVQHENIEKANRIINKMKEDTRLVPDKKIVVVTNFISKWFSRVVLIVGLFFALWIVVIMIQKFLH